MTTTAGRCFPDPRRHRPGRHRYERGGDDRGLLTRSRGRIGGVMSWPSLALVAIYLLNSYALYFFSS